MEEIALKELLDRCKETLRDLFEEEGDELRLIEERIDIDPQVLLGAPRIKGTRVSVSHIVRLIAYGWTTDEILKSYPHLTKDDVKAALIYAVRAVDEKSEGIRKTIKIKVPSGRERGSRDS